jgi:hypothetical protein
MNIPFFAQREMTPAFNDGTMKGPEIGQGREKEKVGNGEAFEMGVL